MMGLSLTWLLLTSPPGLTDKEWKRLDELSSMAASEWHAGHYEQALTYYRRVEALLAEGGDDTTDEVGLNSWNIGRCLEHLERYDEAMTAFESAAERYHLAEKKAAARSKAQEMRTHLYGALTVTCDAPRDRTRVELIGPGNTPRPGRACGEAWDELPVGPYLVIGITDDDLRVEERIELLGRHTKSIHLRFPGAIEIRGPEGLPVTIDDRPAGPLPLRRDGLEPRKWRIRVDYAAGPPFTHTVTVPAGQRVSIVVPRPDAPQPAFALVPVTPLDRDDDLRAMLPWVFTAGAIGAGAIGSVFLYSGETNEDKAAAAHALYRAECSPAPDARCDPDRFGELRERVRSLSGVAVTDRTIGWISVGLSVALLGAATWTLIDDWPAAIGRVEIGGDDHGASFLYRGDF